MGIKYKKLFHLLIDKEMTVTDVIELAGISGNIFTRIRRNQYISLESIEKICGVLNCKVDDILEFEKEQVEETK